MAKPVRSVPPVAALDAAGHGPVQVDLEMHQCRVELRGEDVPGPLAVREQQELVRMVVVPYRSPASFTAAPRRSSAAQVCHWSRSLELR